MKKEQQIKDNEQNSSKLSSTYKVKEENIKKMHEYLKKQNNGK